MAVDQSLANALFGALIVLCGLLLFMEVRHPNNKVAAKVLRQSHATNTSAFLFNNVIMSILSVSSLLVVTAQYSQYGLLAGFPDGVVKWVVSFVLMDFSVYAWHYVGHHSEFLWRFHKVHHSDKSFHVTTGLRFHIFDQLLEVAVECICVILIGVSAQIVIVCEVLRMAFVFFHHSNLSFPGEKVAVLHHHHALSPSRPGLHPAVQYRPTLCIVARTRRAGQVPAESSTFKTCRRLVAYARHFMRHLAISW
jgi:sterol desaturase/sphingolipid hydroxylase (fatty acid hydroxylase superfamily)